MVWKVFVVPLLSWGNDPICKYFSTAIESHHLEDVVQYIFEAAAPHPLNSLICWTKIWCACMFMSDDFTKWLLPLDLPGGVAAWHLYIKYMKVATQFLCHSFKWQMENCCCTTTPWFCLGHFLCPGNMPIHFGNVHIRGPNKKIPNYTEDSFSQISKTLQKILEKHTQRQKI